MALLAAWGAGALLGGSLTRLAAVPWRARSLLGAALLVQVAASFGPGAAYPGGLGLSALLALAFLAHNRRLPGMALVAGGLLLNALVVLANGAMPVSATAAARAGVRLDAVTGGEDPRHLVAGEGTPLGALGDVVPVALPLRPEVASPGDVLVVAGLVSLVVGGMRRAPRRYRPGLTAGGTERMVVNRPETRRYDHGQARP